MTGRSINRNVDWLDLHSKDYYLTLEIGNEYRLVGLNYFGIPTLFEYTPNITPFFYAITSRLLAPPDDLQMRSVVVLRHIDPRILAMLGVRFVITDREYDGPANLRASFQNKAQTSFLYEVAEPNFGNYSPVVVTKIGRAPDIIARLADPEFDPTHEIIAEVPADTSALSPAREAHLAFEGDGLRLQAESDGRSILLIPLEFSRCLEATPFAYEKPLLFRANLLETGVLFSKRLDTLLKVRLGAFLNPACRLRDFFDARALEVGLVPRRLAQGRLRANDR
jgi:hypothetical protein